MKGNKGTSKLAGVLKGMAAGEAAAPPVIELGTIQGDYSLLTDRFPIAIPRSDYLICRSLTLDDPLTTTKENQGQHAHGPSGEHGGHSSGNGQHTHPETEGAHGHEIKLPEKMQPLKPGDRVLVVWVNDGTDAVVVDIVVPG